MNTMVIQFCTMPFYYKVFRSAHYNESSLQIPGGLQYNGDNRAIDNSCGSQQRPIQPQQVWVDNRTAILLRPI